MKHALAIAALMFGLLLPSAAVAQQNGAEPILRMTIDPSRVVVGQAATLRIEVLAPNYMTAPPELPDFQVRNAVTRQLQSVNETEEHDGVTYAGVRFEYAIHPQEPGSYAIATQAVTVKYAAEPPATRRATLALPPIAFQAFIPDAASALQPFLAAHKLTIEQTVVRSSDQLKVGDAVTRTVTVRAEGTPAMLLPPLTFPAIHGLKLYPSQPSLQDKDEGRTGMLSSARVDSAVYMIESAGGYALPAIDIGWWNIGSGRIEQAHLDAVPFDAAANPAAGSTAPADRADQRWNWAVLTDLAADHWRLILLGAVGIAGLGWLTPGIARRITDARRRRREAYRRSEAFAFSRLRRAARRRDARSTYFALLDWLPHLDAAEPLDTLSAFKGAARDPALDREIDVIEAELFARQRDPHSRWSPRLLLHHAAAARRDLRRRSGRGDAARRDLNPNGVSRTREYAGRTPAR
ncbi:BatD family protein [Bradyrhizobium sp.]|uniref:BatD family protein n=1 Tax=Bradyrhizobium sp. TaxID=376 RepID=UPI0039E3C459